MTAVPWLSVLLALVAAFLFACASVAQQSAASSVPEGTPLITSLLRSPRWWAGVLGDGGGYAVQVAALYVGSVLVVQPLIVTMLLFALPMSAKFTGRALSATTWLLAVLLAVALAVFIVVGDPSEGRADAAFSEWIVPLAAAGVIIGFAALCGLFLTAPGVRALLLGTAGGLLFGIAAAMTKFVTDLAARDVWALTESWQTYALVACGVTGFYFQQRAFQVGPLSASLPAVTIGEPIGAAFIGIAVLGERIRTEGVAVIAIAVAVGTMLAATVLLSRTQASAQASRQGPVPSLGTPD